jgi:amino acid transporter
MRNHSDKSTRRETAAGTLGTFGGVFTPSILTILGIILFSRLGYVLGSAGLGRALIILPIANAISVMTSLSLSAISTNIRVKVGGIYYLISRTLGPEFGGAIGIVLFLAQSVSIAFYCIGFGEVLAVIVSAENVRFFPRSWPSCPSRSCLLLPGWAQSHMRGVHQGMQSSARAGRQPLPSLATGPRRFLFP